MSTLSHKSPAIGPRSRCGECARFVCLCPRADRGSIEHKRAELVALHCQGTTVKFELFSRLPAPPGGLRPWHFTNPNAAQVLSRTSWSVTRLVKHHTSQGWFALKTTDLTSAAQLNQSSHVYTELRALRSLFRVSPFVQSAVAAMREHGSNELHFVLDYAPGGHFFDMVKRRKGRIEEEHLKFYMVEIALGLEHLHSMGILHRNLTLDSILLSSSGHVIISDLNFAKILPGPSDRAYTICGPVGLMAPEVMHNVGYGFPSDWWMYGILFHEVLVGEPPNLQYSSSTRVDVAAADNTEHGHEASSALDGISKGGCIGHSAWDLLQRLLDPNPRTRLTGDRVTHNGGASNATAVRNKGGAGNKSGVRRRAGEVDKNDAMEVNNNTIHKHRWFQFYQHTRLVWASFEELEHTPPLFSAQEHKPPHTHVPRSLPGNRRHHANKSSDKQQQQPTNRGGGVDGKEPRFGVKCSSGGDGGRGGNSVPGGSVAVVVMPNARLYGALPVFGDTDLSANRLAIRHDHDILRHAPRCRHHLDFPNNATIATAMRSFTSRTTAQPQI